MTKIVDLNGEPVNQDYPTINPQLMHLAEFIQSRVLKGDVTGLIVTFIRDDFKSEGVWAGLDNIPAPVIIGSIEILKINLANLFTESCDDFMGEFDPDDNSPDMA